MHKKLSTNNDPCCKQPLHLHMTTVSSTKRSYNLPVALCIALLLSASGCLATYSSEFLWLPLSELKAKERVLVTLTYAHRDKIEHYDCDENTSNCNSRIIALEVKTAFCRFRETGSPLFWPGLLKESFCHPLQQSGFTEAIAVDNQYYQVEVLAKLYPTQYLFIEIADDTVRSWAELPNEGGTGSLVFCSFQQEVHGQNIQKIGFTYTNQDVCHRLSTALTPNKETTANSNITHFLSGTTKIIPILTSPDCSYESIDDSDFYHCSIYKCWSSENTYSGKDTCTGNCLTKDCIYHTHYPYGSEGTERCCQGSPGCYEDCLTPEKPVIIGLTVGFGGLALCLTTTTLICMATHSNICNGVGDGCKAGYRGISRLLGWIAGIISTLTNHCLQCPECCAHSLVAIAGYGDGLEQNQENHDAMDVNGEQLDLGSYILSPRETDAHFSDDPPPSYHDVIVSDN